ncbi:transcriptional regulator [Streptomyces laurentii]|uniref:Transcriptional regulator n=1 Tax=Streptomyces laurentii TaxID=39478 RepID=A0A160NY91_STRLU|nr:transcriptional regulator [Streptomyces laurentii]
MAESRPNVHRRRFGSALRSLRRAAGFSMEEAATRLGLHGKPALSKIENGKQRVSGLGLTAIFEIYGVESEETRAKVKAMAALAAPGKRTNLLDEYQDAIREPFEDYLLLEGLAERSETLFLQVIPGLLQTRAYATSIVERSKAWSSKREVDRFVDLRLRRQAVLTRENPLNLWCILDEAVLHRAVGGPEVMRDQLESLLRVTEEHEHVGIQVLPFGAGAHAAPDGSFQLLGFQMGSPVVVVQTRTTSVYLEEDADVERYQSAFDDLRAQALDLHGSRHLIQQLIKDAKT